MGKKRMEVAAALLDASRKLSLGNTSNSNVSNISDSSWDSSMNETTDKNRELPGSSLWLGNWAKRSRSYSESSCPSSTNPTEKLNATAWLGGWQIPIRSNTQQTPNNTPNLPQDSSSRTETEFEGRLPRTLKRQWQVDSARLICTCLQYEKTVSASLHKLVKSSHVAKRTRTSNA